MNDLTHIIEPAELLLTWQPSDEGSAVRTRRVVGRVWRRADGRVVFRYLHGTEDFEEAKDAGFLGFPAFSLRAEESDEGVLDALLRRLPPPKRDDFALYLRQHGLPYPFAHSPFALLAYTGARLPSDGFGVVPVFPNEYSGPIDFRFEIAGLRHTFLGDLDAIHVGDPIDLVLDPSNAFDSNAIAVEWNGHRLGFINRVLCKTVKNWLHSRTVSGAIARVNGKPGRPLVYVQVQIQAPSVLA